MKTSYNKNNQVYTLELNYKELNLIYNALSHYYDYNLTLAKQFAETKGQLESDFKNISFEIDTLWQDIDELFWKSKNSNIDTRS